MTRAPAVRIPFNRPVHIEGDREAVLAAIEGGVTASNGPFTQRCEALLGAAMARPVLLTTSCTHALEMAALLLEVGPGDEVIVPSFTFVSTATAFAMRGAHLRFVDCDRYGNLDLAHVERQIGKRTRAVVAVHYAGNSCEMSQLLALCDARGIVVVEDAAQAVGSLYRGQPLGTLGAIGCLSFHETKSVIAGEGGGLVLNRASDLDRAHVLRDKGTNRRRFLAGQADKYTWVDVGSSYGLSDLNAAYLSVQLDQIERILERRRTLWRRYRDALQGPLQTRGFELIDVPEYNSAAHHLFAVVWDDRQMRDAFIAHMAGLGILTPFHYVPLHSSPYGQRYAEPNDAFPNTDRLGTSLVRLPLFYNMTNAEQDEVIEGVTSFIALQRA